MKPGRVMIKMVLVAGRGLVEYPKRRGFGLQSKLRDITYIVRP